MWVVVLLSDLEQRISWSEKNKFIRSGSAPVPFAWPSIVTTFYRPPPELCPLLARYRLPVSPLYSPLMPVMSPLQWHEPLSPRAPAIFFRGLFLSVDPISFQLGSIISTLLKPARKHPLCMHMIRLDLFPLVYFSGTFNTGAGWLAVHGCHMCPCLHATCAHVFPTHPLPHPPLTTQTTIQSATRNRRSQDLYKFAGNNVNNSFWPAIEAWRYHLLFVSLIIAHVRTGLLV